MRIPRVAVLLALVCSAFGPLVPVTAAGPDVIVGELVSPTDYGRLGDTVALAIATTSCNAGTVPLNWYAVPSNMHPVISQALYRLKDGRMEQLGRAWLKHGISATQGSTCFGDCQPNLVSTRLGVHCSDTYGAGLNSGPLLGPRGEINPTTGYFNGLTVNDHTSHVHTAISHGLQVKHADLGLAGARYFFEAQYVHANDAQAGNGNNNASYREYTVTGDSSNWTFAPVAITVREQPAISVWSGATFTTLDSWPVDGRIIVAYVVTDLGGGQRHYEYAVYNMNSERGIRSFSVPTGSAAISNVGFSAPLSHDEGYSNDPWSSAVADGYITWSTAAFGDDPNANAIRWGASYNFWFDADAAPTTSTAMLERFKPGDGATVIGGPISAPASADCNGNGTADDQDIASLVSQDCNGNTLPDECELDGNDCNATGTPDDCEIAQDCNGNGLPDECDAVGNDCNTDMIPDECQSDCDLDGVIDPCDAASDCNGNVVSDVCDTQGIAGGSSTHSSGTIDLPITDAGMTTSTIQVAAAGPVLDVNLQFNVSHTFDAQLRIMLLHNGTMMGMAVNRGGSGDNFIDTILDDEAAMSLFLASPPFTGTFKPDQSLGPFDGLTASGEWSLVIQDQAAGETGTLHYWNVTIETAAVPPTSSDTNANVVPDECECPTCQGDMDTSGGLNGGDVQQFLDAMVGSFDVCADMDYDGPPVTTADMDAFVSTLLNASGPCP